MTNRVRIAFLLKVLGRKLSSAKKFKFGQIEVEAFEEEVEEAVTSAGANVSAEDLPRTVPEEQVRAAKNFKERARATQLPKSSVLEAVRRQIFDLANEYEIARAQMQSSYLRTRKMNEIAAGMRTLALTALPLRTELTRSDSIGKRLAAICILQVEPRPRYFRWLIERVKTEDQPFVFYQAALAILELVKKKLYINPEETRAAIQDALRVISGFPAGQPDQNTLDVLNEALTHVS